MSNTRWRAKLGKRYWKIVMMAEWCDAIPCVECGSAFDDALYASGNYFRTKREAQAMNKQIKQLLKGEQP